MKKIIFMCLLFLTLSIQANAKDIYYTNEMNVAFSKEEYDFVSSILFDGYQKTMTEEEFNNIFLDNTIHSEIRKVQSNYADGIVPMASSYIKTQNKLLTMTSVCTGTTCLITINLEWLNLPSTRSYDVIGARFQDTSLFNTPTTKLFADSNVTSFNDNKIFSNGVGVSVKLPTGNSKLIITQTFRIYKQGMVFGSYQHAIENISLSNSQRYTLSLSGYGDVFLFDTIDIRNHYDGMDGVSFAL